MSSTFLEYKDLTSYITSLPKTVIEKIFEHPTTCLAIFRLVEFTVKLSCENLSKKLAPKFLKLFIYLRELPELAKVFVIRLLLLNQEVPQSTVNSWVDPKYQK